MQVLSNSGPGPDLVPGPDGVALAREVNDHLAAAVAKHPEALRGLRRAADGEPRRLRHRAQARGEGPEASSARMIHGTTEGRFLDHPSYDGLLAAAVELDVPIYIHPTPAARAVSGRPITPACRKAPTAWSRPPAGAGIRRSRSTSLRMVLAGTFDKHPKLKMIIGHMGEMLPVMLARLDDVSRGRHRASQAASRASTIVEQVWITTSGIFSQPPFIAALQTFGIDRIMFSVDYPFAPRRAGPRVPRRGRAGAGRHGEALPRQRGRAAEAEGVKRLRCIRPALR